MFYGANIHNGIVIHNKPASVQDNNITLTLPDIDPQRMRNILWIKHKFMIITYCVSKHQLQNPHHFITYMCLYKIPAVAQY